MPLQVADAIAYESYRYVTEVKYGMQSERWQFEIIRPTIRSAHVFSKEAILKIIEEERW